MTEFEEKVIYARLIYKSFIIEAMVLEILLGKLYS